MKLNANITKILLWTITFITPLVILMISVRLLIMPSYARLAYRLPAFPEDFYGFSLEDRFRWSEPSINYLVNYKNISYLSNLAFDSGEPVFNARELSHMVDVKAVVTGMRVALVTFSVVLFTIIRMTKHRENHQWVTTAFYWGGWVTIGLVVAVLMFIALNFDSIFTWFHLVFFESGTWQFHPADTLIRLFPMRFWRDAFIFVALQSLLYAGVLIVLTKIQMKALN